MNGICLRWQLEALKVKASFAIGNKWAWSFPNVYIVLNLSSDLSLISKENTLGLCAMRRLRLGGLIKATRLLFEQWLWIKHVRYNKDPLHAGQAACVRFNLRCIYSVRVCVCVAVKAEVILLIISSAFLYTSHLNLPSCTCLHFAPEEAEPPAVQGIVSSTLRRAHTLSLVIISRVHKGFWQVLKIWMLNYHFFNIWHHREEGRDFWSFEKLCVIYEKLTWPKRVLTFRKQKVV